MKVISIGCFQKSVLPLLLFLFSFAGSINAQFYISPNGKDDNPGTKSYPFSSINVALEKIAQMRKNTHLTNDVDIIVRGGTYYITEPIIITPNKWDGNGKLTIRGEKNNTPIIKGSLRLQHFEKISDKLWKMDISQFISRNKLEIQQLFINGRRAVRARTPNDGILFKTGEVKESPINGTTKTVLKEISLTSEQMNSLKSAQHNIENVVISFNHKWDRTRGYIDNFSTKNKKIDFIAETVPPWLNLTSNSQFFLENSMAFLDIPGEWFLDVDGILYYIPKESETIGTTIVEVPILDELIQIKGITEKKVQNISFENLSLQHTKYIMPQKGEKPQQAAHNTSASIIMEFAQNINFEECEIANISNNAVWMKAGCINNKIFQCYIHDLGIGGIKIGDLTPPVKPTHTTEGNLVDNNIIHNGGYEIPTGVGIIIFHSGNNKLTHNDIGNFKYTGISVGWVWGYGKSVATNNVIDSNHIHHLGWGQLSDMGGVYTLGPSDGTVISNNVIHDIYSYDYGGWGLYTDEGSTGISIVNNLVYNCKSSGFHQHYGKDNIVSNNIFANQIKAQLEATRRENHLSFTFTNNIIYFKKGVLIGKPGWDIININSDRNLYWDTRTNNIRFLNYTFTEWKNKTGKDRNSIIADPMFRDPGNDDFSFTSYRNISKINFVPFDYKRAGVYGSNSWKLKAQLNPTTIESYNSTIKIIVNSENEK